MSTSQSNHKSVSVNTVALLVAADVNEDAVPSIVAKLEQQGLTPDTCTLIMGDLDSDMAVGMPMLEQGYQMNKIIPTVWDDLETKPVAVGTRKDGSKFNRAAPAVRNNQAIALADVVLCVYPKDTEFAAVRQAWRMGKKVMVVKVETVEEQM